MVKSYQRLLVMGWEMGRRMLVCAATCQMSSVNCHKSGNTSDGVSSSDSRHKSKVSSFLDLIIPARPEALLNN